MNIYEIKIKHKDLYLFKFNDKEAVLFRPLSFNEYVAYRDMVLEYPKMKEDLYDYIFQQCFIDGFIPHKKDTSDNVIVDYVGVPAGVVDTIVNVILSLSGVDNADAFFEELNSARESCVLRLEDRLFSMISNTFKYTDDEIRSMTWRDILKLLVYTELIMSNDIPASPFKPADSQSTKPRIDFEKQNKEFANL